MLALATCLWWGKVHCMRTEGLRVRVGNYVHWFLFLWKSHHNDRAVTMMDTIVTHTPKSTLVGVLS